MLTSPSRWLPRLTSSDSEPFSTRSMTSSTLKERKPSGINVTRLQDRQRLPVQRSVLKDSHPPIWRRFLVPDGTLGQLHEIIHDVMGWKDSHLHVFIIRNEYYVVHDFGTGMNDEEDMLIRQEVASMDREVRFIYVYDSGDDMYEVGDGWEHEIVLEKTLEPEPKVTYPRCIEGARACPPEDCGGVWGYAEFLEAIATRSTRATRRCWNGSAASSTRRGSTWMP